MFSLDGIISLLIDITPLTANLGGATGKRKGVINAGIRVRRKHEHVLIVSSQFLRLINIVSVRTEIKSANK